VETNLTAFHVLIVVLSAEFKLTVLQSLFVATISKNAIVFYLNPFIMCLVILLNLLVKQLKQNPFYPTNGMDFYNKLIPVQIKYCITIYLTDANFILIKL
jgi:hypothetical protein